MNKTQVVFEKVSKEKKPKQKHLETSPNLLLIGGAAAIAGSAATVLGRPLEVIEQNITTQGKYFKKPWSEVAKGLTKERALWTGTGSKLLKVAPTVAITLGVFEFLKSKLN